MVSFIATVGNYEYGFYWNFYQDGAIQLEVKLTGVISNGASCQVKPKWGALVAPQVYGPIHQHFFNVRLDMMVDGPDNSVYEVNTVADPRGPENPYHNAFHTEATLLETERRRSASSIRSPRATGPSSTRRPQPTREPGGVQAHARRKRAALRRPGGIGHASAAPS